MEGVPILEKNCACCERGYISGSHPPMGATGVGEMGDDAPRLHHVYIMELIGHWILMYHITQ